jgi:drug/metabolite transporter (DMT)-like permease
MLDAIIASLGYAGGVVTDKIILSKYKIPILRFIPLLFIWLTIITAIFVPLWGEIKIDRIISARYIILFLAMILIASVWNYYYARGLQKEEIHEFELIMLLSPLMTIIFAEIFLPAERSLGTLTAGLVASLALIITRFRRHHLKIGKTAWMTMLAMVLMSFESIIIKELLSVLSPVMLYFVRTAVISLVFIILYKPKLFEVPRDVFGLTIISAIFGVVQMVLRFYGFQNLGVIETTTILVLGPFLVYFFSFFYFKEKIFKRDVFAALVVVASILWVTFK